MLKFICGTIFGILLPPVAMGLASFFEGFYEGVAEGREDVRKQGREAGLIHQK